MEPQIYNVVLNLIKFENEDPEDDHWYKTDIASFDFGEPSTSSTTTGPGEIETIDWSGRKISDARSAKALFENPTAVENRFVPVVEPRNSTPRNERRSLISTDPHFQSLSAATSPGFLGSPILKLKNATSASTNSLQGQRATSVCSVGSIGSNRSAGDSSITQSVKRTPVQLEADNRMLIAQIKRMDRDRYRPPDVNKTVRQMVLGEAFSLEMYKSKEDKLKLLKAALEISDGNVITTVVIFLRKTLNDSLFIKQLLDFPVAANHYVSFLKSIDDHDQLISTLCSIGRKEDAAMIEFKHASDKTAPTAKISALKTALQSRFESDPYLSLEAAHVKYYISLLERQIPINEDDDNAKTSSDTRFNMLRKFPKQLSLIDQSIFTTLYYCCLYHYDLPETSYASPKYIKLTYNISDKPFGWISMKALARQQRWPDIERVLTSKSMFGNIKVKAEISPAKLVNTLNLYNAPPQVITFYLNLVSNVQERLQLAIKLERSNDVVDCYVASKDRIGLLDYKSKLTPHTGELKYAESMLNNSANKWKN